MKKYLNPNPRAKTIDKANFIESSAKYESKRVNNTKPRPFLVKSTTAQVVYSKPGLLNVAIICALATEKAANPIDEIISLKPTQYGKTYPTRKFVKIKL